MIAVICNSKKDFDDFIKPWVDYEDQRKFRKVSKRDDIMGIRFTDVIRIGAFYKNRDADELYELASRRIRK